MGIFPCIIIPAIGSAVTYWKDIQYVRNHDVSIPYESGLKAKMLQAMDTI